MNNSKYWKARSYLYKLDRVHYKDLCHDAYVSYWKGTGKNLFDQSEALITTVIKRTAYSFWRSRSWKINGDMVTATEFVDDSTEDSMAHKFNAITPLDELIANELLEKYQSIRRSARTSRQGNADIIKQILDKRIEGYGNREIADELGVSKALVTYYVKESGLNKLKL